LYVAVPIACPLLYPSCACCASVVMPIVHPLCICYYAHCASVVMPITHLLLCLLHVCYYACYYDLDCRPPIIFYFPL
jgi:hypothetical protein